MPAQTVTLLNVKVLTFQKLYSSLCLRNFSTGHVKFHDANCAQMVHFSKGHYPF
jgi:hypothetical protein